MIKALIKIFGLEAEEDKYMTYVKVLARLMECIMREGGEWHKDDCWSARAGAGPAAMAFEGSGG